MTEPDDGLYDFAEPQAPPKRKPAPQPVIDANPPLLAYRSLREDKAAPAEAEQIKDFYLPLGLLIGGIVVEFLVATIWPHHPVHALLAMLIDLTFGTAVMLVAMLLAARIRHIELGKIKVAAFKLAAVGIAPVAINEFMSPVLRFVPLMGPLLGFGIEFILFFALLGALFDLEESDTWYCVCIIFVVRIATFVLLGAIFG